VTDSETNNKTNEMTQTNITPLSADNFKNLKLKPVYFDSHTQTPFPCHSGRFTHTQATQK